MYIDRKNIDRLQSGLGLETVVLFLGMAAFAALVAYLVFGPLGVVLGLGVSVFGWAVLPRTGPSTLLRSGKVRTIDYNEAPILVSAVAELAEAAGLRRRPRLGYIPSPTPNALTVGDTSDSLIVVTGGLLSRLTNRQLRAVLAHEIGHIKNGDIRILEATTRLSAMTVAVTRMAMLFTFFLLPFAVMGGVFFSPLAFPVLIGAPILMLLLQTAISRRREFAADLTAAEISGDPHALAEALDRLRRPAPGLLGMILARPRPEEGSPFTTHPATDERIRRLRALMPSPWQHGRLRRVSGEARFL